MKTNLIRNEIYKKKLFYQLIKFEFHGLKQALASSQKLCEPQ